MEYDELKHFEKLLDEFEQDALAADADVSLPSSSKRHQRDLTRGHLVALVEGIVFQRDHLVDELNVQPKGAVTEKVAP